VNVGHPLANSLDHFMPEQAKAHAHGEYAEKKHINGSCLLLEHAPGAVDGQDGGQRGNGVAVKYHNSVGRGSDQMPMSLT
jgi:hypothetical protein